MVGWLACRRVRIPEHAQVSAPTRSTVDERLLCAAAATNGDLEELKALRGRIFPWNEWTCTNAAKGGHLKVLKGARERPLGTGRACARRRGAPQGAEVGARERLPVEQVDVRVGGAGRPPRGVDMRARTTARNERTAPAGGVGRPPEVLKCGARERLPVERGDARTRRRAATSRCSSGRWRTAARGRADVPPRREARPPRGAAVGAPRTAARGTSGRARKRERRPPRGADMGARERLPVGRGDVRIRGESPQRARLGARDGCPGMAAAAVWPRMRSGAPARRTFSRRGDTRRRDACFDTILLIRRRVLVRSRAFCRPSHAASSSSASTNSTSSSSSFESPSE